MLPEPVRAAISRSVSDSLQTNFSIDRVVASGGGCINAACRIEGGGRSLFVKYNAASLQGMFAAEAAGLAELRRPAVIRVPEPLVHGGDETISWLVTEYIDFASPRADSECRLGRQLAAMHRFTADNFGWERDNTIGSTPQSNTPDEEWITFLREQRLGFQLRLAARNGFGGALQHKGERLLEGLGHFFTAYSPPASLLHGDLWGGNLAYDESGEPVIFDPAVYYGDREVDLAMTELFGGFGADFYAAYREAWPVDVGYGVRRHLYNLYHILNHANLFGGGYAAQAERMLDRLLAEIG